MDYSLGHRHRHTKTVSATTHTLKGERCPEDQKWYFETVTVKDDTTDNTNCLVSIVRAGTKYPIFWFKDITRTEWEKKSIGLWVFPGEYIQYDWTDMVSGDKIDMVEHGHRKIID